MRRDVGGQNAEEQTGEKSGGDCKGKNAEIQRDGTEVEEIRGAAGKKSVGAPKSEQDSQRSAQPREQYAFREKLPNDARVTSAHRCANSKLARAAHRARQQKIGNVRASNQQQETHGRKKRDQKWLDVPDDVFL